MPVSKSILVLNGPNLNKLGTREPEIYGHQSLADIEQACRTHATTVGYDVEFRQSNQEGDLVEWIQQADSGFAGIIINPAAYTHTSIAIRDALSLISIPIIELHLSNIFRREEFRHLSHVSPVADGMICGFGASGYMLAVDAMDRLLKDG